MSSCAEHHTHADPSVALEVSHDCSALVADHAVAKQLKSGIVAVAMVLSGLSTMTSAVDDGVVLGASRRAMMLASTD